MRDFRTRFVIECKVNSVNCGFGTHAGVDWHVVITIVLGVAESCEKWDNEFRFDFALGPKFPRLYFRKPRIVLPFTVWV